MRDESALVTRDRPRTVRAPVSRTSSPRQARGHPSAMTDQLATALAEDGFELVSFVLGGIDLGRTGEVIQAVSRAPHELDYEQAMADGPARAGDARRRAGRRRRRSVALSRDRPVAGADRPPRDPERRAAERPAGARCRRAALGRTAHPAPSPGLADDQAWSWKRVARMSATTSTGEQSDGRADPAARGRQADRADRRPAAGTDHPGDGLVCLPGHPVERSELRSRPAVRPAECRERAAVRTGHADHRVRQHDRGAVRPGRVRRQHPAAGLLSAERHPAGLPADPEPLGGGGARRPGAHPARSGSRVPRRPSWPRTRRAWRRRPR